MIIRNILQFFPYAQKQAECVIICTEFYSKVYGIHEPFLALDLQHHFEFWMFSFLLRYLFFIFFNNRYCWRELWFPIWGTKSILHLRYRGSFWRETLCEALQGRQYNMLLFAPDLNSQERKGSVWLLSSSLFAISASQSQNTPWICLQLLHECKKYLLKLGR